MALLLDRRRLLQLGTFGAGALVVPGTATAIAAASGFTHGVASGDPSQASVLLWTRFVAKDETKLAAEVSDTASFDKVVAAEEAVASPSRDFCAKTVVKGLQAGRWYYYRFRAPNGDISPIGRTRTLPQGPVGKFILGIFSCSNLPFGWFNAYAHAAARQDIDLIVHLGDYLYEYQRGAYPTVQDALPGRVIDPATEIVHLTDYRLRYASYRADPDLRRLHQYFPMISMWDDHETANDSWQGGAENHQPETEGSWEARKAAAMRAYHEWMPVSDQRYAEYRIGDLATIFRPDTRLAGRVQQLSIARALAGQPDPRAALIAFRDGPWQSAERTILGFEQEKRLADGFRQSVASGARWQVLAQGTVVGSLALSPKAAEWMGANVSERAKTSMQLRLLASSLGLPIGMDMWDGYPAARERLLKSAADADANLVILSGDSHNAWAFDHAVAGVPVGVEFAGQSVTSPGLERDVRGIPMNDVAAATMQRNPGLKWANLDRRGYMAVELTPDRVTSEHVLLDTVHERSLAATSSRISVLHKSNRLAS